MAALRQHCISCNRTSSTSPSLTWTCGQSSFCFPRKSPVPPALTGTAFQRQQLLVEVCCFNPSGGRFEGKKHGALLHHLQCTRERSVEMDAATPPQLDIDMPHEEDEAEEEISRATLLWRAVKLPIYSVALVPLSVGAAAANLHTGVFNWGQYWLQLCSSVLVITWLNLSNDAYDAETGVDKDKKESVVNMTGSTKVVLAAAYVCLVLGFTGLIRAAQHAGDMRVASLLAVAIICGYIYQCPPFRLSYKGLGEPLCFLAFGPFATTAFYLSQASGMGRLPVTLTVLGVSVLVGITTSLILFCSHFHQIEGDLSVGKMSPLVRLGTEKGAKVVQGAVVALYSTIVMLTAVKALPLSCSFFSLLTLPIGKLVSQFIGKNHANKSIIFMAKYYCVRLHIALGAALVLGLTTATVIPAPTFW